MASFLLGRLERNFRELMDNDTIRHMISIESKCKSMQVHTHSPPTYTAIWRAATRAASGSVQEGETDMWALARGEGGHVSQVSTRETESLM